MTRFIRFGEVLHPAPYFSTGNNASSARTLCNYYNKRLLDPKPDAFVLTSKGQSYVITRDRTFQYDGVLADADTVQGFNRFKTQKHGLSDQEIKDQYIELMRNLELVRDMGIEEIDSTIPLQDAHLWDNDGPLNTF